MVIEASLSLRLLLYWVKPQFVERKLESASQTLSRGAHLIHRCKHEEGNAGEIITLI